MLNAITSTGSTAYPGMAASRVAEQPQAAQPAAAALAALTPSRPDLANDDDTPGSGQADFGVVYGPSGLPENAVLPVAVTAAPSTPETRSTNSRDPSARLAMQSTQLNALLSSMMSPQVEDSRPTGSQPLPVDDNGQLARLATQSVINRMYAQF